MSSKAIENAEIAQEYQRKTDKEHVLHNPGMYIGSTDIIESNLWVFDDETNKIVQKSIRYIPAMYKLFDEIIVNARDHVLRIIQLDHVDKKNVTYIDVAIDKETGIITISNDGNGIDVVQHPTEKIWIPELIFAHLRSSTNYDKTEKKS